MTAHTQESKHQSIESKTQETYFHKLLMFSTFGLLLLALVLSLLARHLPGIDQSLIDLLNGIATILLAVKEYLH